MLLAHLSSQHNEEQKMKRTAAADDLMMNFFFCSFWPLFVLFAKLTRLKSIDGLGRLWVKMVALLVLLGSACDLIG